MAIINTGSLEETVRARSISNSSHTDRDWEIMRQRTEEFNNRMEKALGYEVDFARNAFESNYNDKLIMKSNKMLRQTRGILARDRFQVITRENVKTDSFVTMHHRQSNPTLQKRIDREIAFPNEAEIGILVYDDMVDNDSIMNIYNGEYTNPYTKDFNDGFMEDEEWEFDDEFDVGGVVLDYEEYNNMDIRNDLNDSIRTSLIEMNELLEELIDEDITPY